MSARNGPEKPIEQYLIQRVREDLKGRAYKFTSPGKRSVPDRIAILPGGHMFFIELKAPGRVPTEEQQREIAYLKSLGHWAYWADQKSKIDILIKFWKQKLIEEELI